jgi:hypothetical protein
MYSIKENEMFKKYIFLILLFCFSFSIVQYSIAQENEGSGLVIEGEIETPVPENLRETVDQERMVVKEVVQGNEESGLVIEGEFETPAPENLKEAVDQERMVEQEGVQENEESGFVVEGEVETFAPKDFKEEADQERIVEEEIKEEVIVQEVGQFITSDVLTNKDVVPIIKFYILSDIDKKFTGLVSNLKLEKIYGVLQNDKTAIAFFDYSYTSVRNPEIILSDKGKMTLVQFNSGKWFNEELSIYLKDEYNPYAELLNRKKQQQKE